jgi:PHD/YefM family antitoxin component YafN of YafNO toxin-antitoxin module
MLAQNESIKILKETKKLDQISKNSTEPVCVTKNGKEYLYILNPTLFKRMVDGLKYEKEINLLLSKVNQSKNDIEANRVHDFDEFIQRKKSELQ